MGITGYEADFYRDVRVLTQAVRSIDKSLAAIARNTEIIAAMMVDRVMDPSSIPEVGDGWFEKAKQRAKAGELAE